MTYLANSWYMAGWARELSAGPIARRICDIPIVVFRDTPTTVAALHDRCPHRFAPLSFGDVETGGIRCRYHGLAFDRTGACVANPHGPVPAAARVQSFPVVERSGALWLWVGEAAPDEANLPDFSFIDAVPASATSRDYLHVGADYRIVVDNILDLSHVDHLHRDTLGRGGPGGSGTFTGVTPTVSREGNDRLTLNWKVEGAVARPLEQPAMGLSGDQTISRSTRLVWTAPSVMSLATTVRSEGETAHRFDNTHVLTPETSSTSHYFFSSTRDFAVEDENLNAEIAATRRRVFLEEDEWMCRGVQDRMEGADFWALRPALMRTDTAAGQARRMLKRLIAAQASAPETADKRA